MRLDENTECKNDAKNRYLHTIVQLCRGNKTITKTSNSVNDNTLIQ